MSVTLAKGGNVSLSKQTDNLTTIAVGLGWYFAWFAARGVRVSRMIGDISQGQDATPIWIPQLVMAAGVLLLAVALTDHLVSLARGGPGIIAGERPAES